MIIPRTILLVYVGVVLSALGVAAAIAPQASHLCIAGAALALLVPLLDAILSGHKLEGLGVAPGQLVRLTKGAAGQIEVHITNQAKQMRRIRIGLALPPELNCIEDEIVIRLPDGAASSAVTFDCLPSMRGRHVIEMCYLGATSLMGLWLRRKSIPMKLEIRVYPNLAGERRRLSALFLTRGRFGIHAQRQVGQGREFEKLREYIPGDAYADIHWKATAKRAKPATKVFQVERTQEVYVIIDSSRLSARGVIAARGMGVPGGMGVPPMRRDGILPSHGQEKTGGETPPGRMGKMPMPRTAAMVPEVTTSLERFVTAAMIMGMAAERQGDLFGVMSFSDRVENFVRARNGKGHYRLCRDSLYALQPSIVTPDYSELFAFIRTRLRRRALLVFLTNLDDPILSESFAESIPLVARQHLVLVNMIQPAGVRPVFSLPAATTDDIYRDLGGHLQWRRLEELSRTLNHRGVRFHLPENEAFCAQLVSQYINIKRRQLL